MMEGVLLFTETLDSVASPLATSANPLSKTISNTSITTTAYKAFRTAFIALWSGSVARHATL